MNTPLTDYFNTHIKPLNDRLGDLLEKQRTIRFLEPDKVLVDSVNLEDWQVIPDDPRINDVETDEPETF